MAQTRRRAKTKPLPLMQEVFCEVLGQTVDLEGEDDPLPIKAVCGKTVQHALVTSIIRAALHGDLKAADFIMRVTQSPAQGDKTDQPFSVTVKVVE